MSKTILITGNSKGIGRYLSEYYLKKGYNVIGCSRSTSDLKHNNYIHFEGDVSIEKDVINIVKKGKKHFGSIDILINNAGRASLNHSLLTPSTTVKALFETNFNGSFFFSRECSKIMLKNKFGRIINITSIVGHTGNLGQSNYSAAKAGIIGMSKSLAIEYAKKNITINCVSPGFIQTAMTMNIAEKVRLFLTSRIPMGRLGTGEDVSNCVAFLSSEESSYITGETIHVNGGMYMS